MLSPHQAFVAAVLGAWPLHLVVDSVLGIAIGVTFVLAYLSVLRWFERRRSPDGDRNGRFTQVGDQRSQDP